VTQLEQLLDMLLSSKTPFRIEPNSVIVLRQHLGEETLNYIETKYAFKDGNLLGISVDQHGCPICCETEEEEACSDHNLFAPPKQQGEIIARITANRAANKER
jgi:hypothetical protein